MTACDVAHHYIAAIQAGRYDQLGALFAEDAVFYNPEGRILEGRAKIAAFYSEFLGHLKPIVRGVRFVCDEEKRVCVFELESRMRRDDDGQWRNDPSAPFALSAIDRITVNAAGTIQHMIVYTAPPTDG